MELQCPPEDQAFCAFIFADPREQGVPGGSLRARRDEDVAVGVPERLGVDRLGMLDPRDAAVAAKAASPLPVEP